MAVPSGTVTFLFTDIEGSTRLWQQDEAAMRVALSRHDEILRRAVADHGGTVFSTMGDGIAAAFATASSAVGAALSAQQLVGAESWPTVTPLRVRMGLHTGEAEQRDGDYFGTAVNRAARLMAVAHGGQVVCSSATAGVVDAEFELVDLGEHRLRDLDRPVLVFQVGVGSFAPLRSLGVLPGNLPSLASSFVGRREELAAVAEELGSRRLVTLTGVGGVGKTRLALQVAAETSPGFTDGAWVCELAVAATDDDVAQVVALALGVLQRQQMTMAESIVDFLRTRHVLLVLDNCEHLLDAAAELADMVLAGAPGVRILATSQEALGVPGEHLWPVRSMLVAADPARAASSDAVALFAERARAVSPGFLLDEARTPAVVEVCRRLDGIPLAIELAAARVVTMTPAEIAGHLDERFRLLTGGRRGRVKRHQTLHAALEWSYSLLGDRERAVFDVLGVFPASFDEAAAVAVCAGDGMGRWDVIDALASLAAKSLVGADQSGDATRYQLLETLRHFSRDRAGGRLDELRRRHAEHYAAFAEEAGRGLTSADELMWRARVTAELDNLRAAANWAFDAPERDDLVLGVRVIDGLSPESSMLYSSGLYATAASAISRVEVLDAAQRCVVVNAAAHAAFQRGDYEQARVLGSRVLADSDTITFAWMGSLAMVALGSLAFGDADAAMSVIAQARQQVDTDGASDWLAAGMLSVTSFVSRFVGDQDTASAAIEQNLAIARRIGAPTLLANALALHATHIFEQDPDEGLQSAEDAIRLVDAGASDTVHANAAFVVATVRSARGDARGAARSLRSAIERVVAQGRREVLAPLIRVAVLVLAANPSGFKPAATVSGAADGPILGHYARLTNVTRDRYDLALVTVATGIGENDYAKAVHDGAEMTYDDIVTYTLDQLDRLAESGSKAVR